MNHKIQYSWNFYLLDFRPGLFIRFISCSSSVAGYFSHIYSARFILTTLSLEEKTKTILSVTEK
uniref:Uncharacterized protein n=1 Tax=Anguilla anguilla TaxID=7936 RepID=A0A0E9TK09_ANGAN